VFHVKHFSYLLVSRTLSFNGSDAAETLVFMTVLRSVSRETLFTDLSHNEISTIITHFCHLDNHIS
jgi:hypothetical protein